MSKGMKIFIILSIFTFAFFILTWQTTTAHTPQTSSLGAIGRYKISQSLLEQGNMQVNSRITSMLHIGSREQPLPFSFNICEHYQYFKLTVFHSNPVQSHFILNVELSTGEIFSMNYGAEEGITQIIYSAEPWPAGTHYASLWATGWQVAPLGYVDIQVVTANNLELITEDILPTLDDILTIQAIENSITPQGANFKLKNHSNYEIHFNMNYFFEQKRNANWWRRLDGQDGTGWIGFINIHLQPGEYMEHNVNWQRLGDFPPGEYRLAIPRMLWRWRNAGGIKLTKSIPLYAEFEIGGQP